jgi:hypothetical protein
MRAKHVVVMLGVLLAIGSMAAEAEIFTDNYVVPVVSRGTGKGDTVWKTEICVTNPWDYAMILTDGFVQGGNILVPMQWQLPAGQTLCSSDVVYDWLGRTSWTGAYLIVAFQADNPGLDTRFVVGVKIYNTDPRGTFGQALPMGSYIPEAWSIGSPLSYGLVTGIQNYGTAGVNGFRTNVGVFNPADWAQVIEFHVFDNQGQQLWSTTRTVPAMSQIQISIPSWVVVHGGVGLGVNNGTVFVFPYASIVDNKSGDGVYRPFSIGYENVKRMKANPPGVEVGPRDAAFQLLGSVPDIERMDGPRPSMSTTQE